MDISILLAIQEFRSSTSGIFSTFFAKITLLGESYLPILLILFMYWCIDRQFGRRAVLGLGLGRFANAIAKITACVYRPWIRSPEIIPADGAKTTATGYSFPSGHSTSATLSFGHIGWHFRRESHLLSFILYFTVALVMFSRLYLGVHTPQDVLVGCALSVLMVMLANAVLDWTEKGSSRDLLLLVGTLILVALSIVYIMNKPYPMDYDEAGKLVVDPISMQTDSFSDLGRILGCVLGLVFEGRFVHFSTDTSFARKCARFAVGALLYTFLHAAGRPIIRLFIPDKNIAYIVSTTITMFVVTGLYPLCFTAWETRAKDA